MFKLKSDYWILFFDEDKNGDPICYYGGTTSKSVAWIKLTTNMDLMKYFQDYEKDYFGINTKLITMMKKMDTPFDAVLGKNTAVFKDNLRTFKIPFSFVKREDRDFRDLKIERLNFIFDLEVNKSELKRVISDAGMFKNVLNLTFSKGLDTIDVYSTDESGGSYTSTMTGFKIENWNYEDDEKKIIMDVRVLRRYISQMSGFDYNLKVTERGGLYFSGYNEKINTKMNIFVSPIVKPEKFEVDKEEIQKDISDMNEEITESTSTDISDQDIKV